MSIGGCIDRRPVHGAADHSALFYGDAREYVAGVQSFLEPGLEAGDPIAIAVPGPRLELLTRQLEGSEAPVTMLDMSELGRNPACIIPAVQRMLDQHEGRTLHYVGEPIWDGRSAAEVREATRHEALVNLAWPDAQIRVLCPYDQAALDPRVLADAELTHPTLIRDGRRSDSARYATGEIPSSSQAALEAPPIRAVALSFGIEELGLVRTVVADQAARHGLRSERVGDLVLAVNELASNTIRHGGGRGLMRIWSEPGRIACQVEDPGEISDPLAGRRRQRSASVGGVGLWAVNHLCDLVELRSAADGTIVRVHMAL